MKEPASVRQKCLTEAGSFCLSACMLLFNSVSAMTNQKYRNKLPLILQACSDTACLSANRVRRRANDLWRYSMYIRFGSRSYIVCTDGPMMETAGKSVDKYGRNEANALTDTSAHDFIWVKQGKGAVISPFTAMSGSAPKSRMKIGSLLRCTNEHPGEEHLFRQTIWQGL